VPVSEDAFEALSKVVPRSIASAGVRGRAAPGRTRTDRPLGRQGIDLLAGVPLFSGLSRRQLRQLAEHADVVGFGERETIVEVGQPGGTFFVIVEGSARVTRGARTVAQLGPADFFGEISLLDGGPRTATVRAETPVTAIRIFKRSFEKLVASEPAVATQILVVVAARLRDSERSLTS
jgi:CRP-like cAMP-binding protein